MKTQFFSRPVLFMLGLSLLMFQACKNGGDYVDTNAIYLRHVDSLKQYTYPLIGRSWRIKSQTISTANSAAIKLPVDSCNLSVSYYFSSRNRNPTRGYVYMSYNNSPCPRNHQLTRFKNPDSLYTPYEIDIHPNYLQFMDNGYDDTEYKYSILKLNNDSLVLRQNSGESIITKIYTSIK